mgnify:CR=1 FL=1|jgi:hypothetical protein
MAWSYPAIAMSDDGNPIYDEDDIANPPNGAVEEASKNHQGLQMTYSKAGVCSICHVEGYVGLKDEEGDWIPGIGKKENITVTSQIARNILEGEDVEMTASIDENYCLTSLIELEKFGMRELGKTIRAARGAVYNSEDIPLSVEAGCDYGVMTVTALNRTTDAQQNKISTGLTGYRGGTSSTGSGESNDMGWS